MTGMIQGGWEYVWAAYGLTATVLVLYAISMQLRLRKEPAAKQLSLRKESR